MTIKLIVAVDKQNAIGNADGTLPWKSSTDLTKFKDLTNGHDVLMGRKTFDSLNRKNGLPNRRNIVLTNQYREGNKDVTYIDSLDWIKYHPAYKSDNELILWVIGGATVYAQMLERGWVDEIYLTQVHIATGAPVRFPYPLYDFLGFINDHKFSVHSFIRPDIKPSEPSICFVKLKNENV